MAHAAHEVAVGGGDAALPGGQNAHIAAQARPAGGGGDDAARVQENVREPPAHSLPVDAHGGGNDDAPDVPGQVLPLQNGGGGLQIGQLPVGAGANDNLVDSDVLPLPGAVSVLGEVGIGHGAVHLGKVDVHGALILRVAVRLIGGPGAVYPALHIGFRHRVHGENAVLRPGLNGHVGDGQPVVDRELGNAGPGKFQGLIPGSVHADHADKGQNYVLAGDKGPELPGEVHLDGGGHLEPGLPRRHGGAHVRGPHAGGEGPQGPVGAGVGVRADNSLAGGHQALFRQQGVLDAHLPHVEVVVDVKPPGEGAALLALGGGLDVLVGCEVVHYQGDFALVEHLVKARRLKLVDRHGGGDVVAQHQVQLRLNELPRPDGRKPRVLGQDFLRHGHSHLLSRSL